MYNWLTKTRQGQIVSFLVVLFLIGSYTNLFRSATQKAEEQKKPPEPAQPVPSPPAPSKEPAAEPAAPKPEPTPEPAVTLEKLINELDSTIKTQAAKAQDKLAETGKPAGKKAKIESVWIVIQIKDSSLLQEAAKEILEKIEKDKLAQSDDSLEDAGPKEALENYERILGEYRDAAKKLRKAKANLQTAARIAHRKHSESWRKRALDLRVEIETGEKALAELDRQVKSAKEKIPESPS